MSKKLYIDTFDKEEAIGFTNTQLKISYNLVVLDRYNDKSSPIFTVGKYLCIIFASTPTSMMFIDIRKDPNTINEIINSPDFINKKNQLISLLELHNSTYEDTKNYIELVVGDPPAEPLK